MKESEIFDDQTEEVGSRWLKTFHVEGFPVYSADLRPNQDNWIDWAVSGYGRVRPEM